MDIPESISATSDQDTSQGKLAESVAELVAEPVAEPVAKSFMSFEDWKEIMLRRTGQDPQNLGFRKPSERVSGNRYLPDSEHAGFGEEGEISLNFETYTDNGGHGSSSADVTDRDNVENEKTRQHLDEDGKAATVHLSKDAGKTCKERFSYSSFDAGATVLKTSPGAKNAKAILVENKDTYMLLECDSKSKYVIIELSDDISVDTIVLANFEFFSSMVRHFRVSVSDRYPVKMEKWRELGIFEARNSRDIQPFLVENPQIWAKYVRIEFLSHFGNEYYCPISLLRIHGSRMLDSWKDSEPGRDEDASADMNEVIGNRILQDESQLHIHAKPTHANWRHAEFTDSITRKWFCESNVLKTSEMTCPVFLAVAKDPTDVKYTLPFAAQTTVEQPMGTGIKQ
ncbi:uncharacterized protein UV8b_03736 [Ustilaginoidea virens]|uniref:SUN domain-containing protein n=1 Tax=Ustilaginoidea virens TaxID=1159556 RepID=A0A8E5HPW0_USTVR|nr:uncharacterized protein UV8b_03736 [Ustilaginoidea virens]QUC19495.1 hypothetical protein UV8b_03736 [Ustilaginoidea virens]